MTAPPAYETFVIGAETKIIDERDLDALDRMIATFVLGEPAASDV